MIQEVEHKCEALSSNPSTPKRKKLDQPNLFLSQMRILNRKWLAQNLSNSDNSKGDFNRYCGKHLTYTDIVLIMVSLSRTHPFHQTQVF
jgi:hypothetical protein